MKVETDRVLCSQPAAAGVRPDWSIVLALTGAVIIAILAMYWRTTDSMLTTWSRSVTFAHGYLVVPIALFLIWRKRHEVGRLVPAPDYLGLVLLALAGFVWLVAVAGHVYVVQQYAMMAMIPASVVALAGRHVALALSFPLAFLLLAVPAGAALVPPLMEWTADFTVAALRLSAIPVYRDGNFFSIPSGDWSVVEACSGLRYLIASVTVGVLYAYLTYRQLWKRLLLVGLSVVVPILANGFRAYVIVIIGHLSEMKLAVGIDHLFYGWIFFGIVMLLLFWLGSLWRDPLPDDALGPPVDSHSTPPLPRMATAGFAAAALAIVAAWPLYAARLETADRPSGAPALTSPTATSGWTIQALPLTDWRPHYQRTAASVFSVYGKGDRTVAVYIGYYRKQKKGAELVAWRNSVVEEMHPVWAHQASFTRTEDFGKGPVELRQTLLRSPRQRLVVWDWYRISGTDLSNPYLVKLLLARDKLLGRNDDAAVIMIAAAYDLRPDAAEETLRQFARGMLASLSAALSGVAMVNKVPADGARERR